MYCVNPKEMTTHCEEISYESQSNRLSNEVTGNSLTRQ